MGMPGSIGTIAPTRPAAMSKPPMILSVVSISACAGEASEIRLVFGSHHSLSSRHSPATFVHHPVPCKTTMAILRMTVGHHPSVCGGEQPVEACGGLALA